MKTLVIRPLTTLTIFLSLVVCAFANEPEIIPDDNIILLLKKRVEVAEMRTAESDATMTAGGNLAENARVHIALAKAKIALFRQTGEREQLLEALEYQLTETKKLRLAVKASYGAAIKGVTKSVLMEAELSEFEAELELKNEKQKKPDQADIFLKEEITLLEKRVEVAEKIVKRDDILKAHGAKGTNTNENAIRHINLAKAKIALYRKTGKRELLIKALEEQLEWTKIINGSMKILVKETTTVLETDVMESEISIMEVELELKKAKHKKP
jgi:hypothetical protein